jgi:hypothetical protein
MKFVNNIVWRVGRFFLEGEFATFNTNKKNFSRKELDRIKKEFDLKLRQEKLERILK